MPLKLRSEFALLIVMDQKSKPSHAESRGARGPGHLLWFHHWGNPPAMSCSKPVRLRFVGFSSRKQTQRGHDESLYNLEYRRGSDVQERDSLPDLPEGGCN